MIVKGLNKCYTLKVEKWDKKRFGFTCGNLMTGMTSLMISRKNAEKVRDWLIKELEEKK